jgi:hypothetical protein
MIISWGFFIPLGTLLAVYRRHVGPKGKFLKRNRRFILGIGICKQLDSS